MREQTKPAVVESVMRGQVRVGNGRGASVVLAVTAVTVFQQLGSKCQLGVVLVRQGN